MMAHGHTVCPRCSSVVTADERWCWFCSESLYKETCRCPECGQEKDAEEKYNDLKERVAGYIEVTLPG